MRLSSGGAPATTPPDRPSRPPQTSGHAAMIVDQRRDLAALADLSRSPLSCHDGVMGSQRFRAVIAAGPRDSAVIMVPFDPDEAWGAKADHPVSGTIGGCRIRTRLVPAADGRCPWPRSA